MDREILKKVITEQNEEFQNQPVLIPRILPKDFIAQFEQPEVSVVTGVRRCGKSTFFKQIRSLLPNKSRAYFLDLEHPLLDDFQTLDFQAVYELWFELYPPSSKDRIYIFYDEIQNVRNWERWVRNLAKFKNHKIFVTGSNSQMLSGELATALTGRHRPTHMTPLSFQEIADHILGFSQLTAAQKNTTEVLAKKNKILEDLLKVGGFPRCYLDKNTSLLPLYFNDIITKDIIKRHKIRNSRALVRLGELLCRENTRIFNRTKTAKLLDIKDNSTFSKYCSYFEETFLFYEIRLYSPSLRKQMRSHSKFYCVDPGLPRAVAGSASTGYSTEFENLVFMELKRKFSEVHYWQSENKREVDFLIKDQTKNLRAYQASYSVASDETLNREVAALLEAKKELGIKNLYIVTAAENRAMTLNGTSVQVISLDRFALDFN